MILIRIECLMIFQNLFAYCQPVQLQNNPSGIVIEAPGIFPDKIIFQTDTITETTTSIKSRTTSKWPRVIIGQELFTNPGCNQSVINQIKSYFGFSLLSSLFHAHPFQQKPTQKQSKQQPG